MEPTVRKSAQAAGGAEPRGGAGRHVLRATLMLAFSSLAVSVLGFVKNAVVAYYFGTSRGLDIYLLALVIPDTAAFLATTGLFNFIPIMASEKAQRGEGEAWRAGGKMLTFWALLLVLVLVAAWATAPWLSGLVGPGLRPDERATNVSFTRVLVLMSLGLGLARLLAAVHNYQKHFLVPALGELAFQVGSLLFLVVFHSWGVPALVWGMVFGGAVQLAISFVRLPIRQLRSAFGLDPFHPAVRAMVALTVPVYVGNLGSKVNSLVLLSFASTLSAGSVAALGYGYALAETVGNLLGASLSRAALPFVAQDLAEGRQDAVTRGVRHSLLGMFLILLPASVGLALLARPLVVILLQRGQFDQHSTELTVVALQVYALALAAFAINQYLSSVSYAQKDTTTPMRIGLIRVGITIVLVSTLVSRFGHVGVALAVCAGEIAKLAMMLVALSRPELRTAIKTALIATARTIPALVVMGLGVWQLGGWLNGVEVRPALRWVVDLAFPALVGTLIYVGCLRLLVPKEFSFFSSFTRRALLPAPAASEIAHGVIDAE